MITKTKVASASEQLQENLRTYLDGQSESMLDKICQMVVDTFKPLKFEAAKSHEQFVAANNTLGVAISFIEETLGSDADESPTCKFLNQKHQDYIEIIR